MLFLVLNMNEDDVLDFAQALISAKRELTHCDVCGNITDQERCSICQDQSRDQSVICVVQDPKDVIAMEKMREFNGQYHILNGAISTIDGIDAEDINVLLIIFRLKD